MHVYEPNICLKRLCKCNFKCDPFYNDTLKALSDQIYKLDVFLFKLFIFICKSDLRFSCLKEIMEKISK